MKNCNTIGWLSISEISYWPDIIPNPYVDKTNSSIGVTGVISVFTLKMVKDLIIKLRI